MADVITLGEMLIDFVSIESGVGIKDSPGFLKAPGGAPANVAVALSRLGVRTGFIGMVGNDEFGCFLKETLKKNNVDTSCMPMTSKANTTLAFVSIKADGDRDFIFYRKPGADMLLSIDDIDEEYIENAKLLHIGSISLIDEPSKSATLHTADIAKKNGLLISYDPNIRMNLWPDPKTAKNTILSTLNLCDILKVSDNEMEFLTDTNDICKGIYMLKDMSGADLIMVTKGDRGVTYMFKDEIKNLEGFKMTAVDATGAGDAFTAGLLSKIYNEKKINAITIDKMKDYITYANACGALTVTKKGAIPALPFNDDVINFLR